MRQSRDVNRKNEKDDKVALREMKERKRENS